MSFNNHNESEALAALLCPLLRAGSPKAPFRCLAADDDEMFFTSFQVLQMMGVRKGFFQSKRNYVIESILFIESCFETAHPLIELHITSPHKAAWTGSGEFKQTSATDAMMMMNHIYDALGKPPPGPEALIQIDVTSIWNQIFHLLEKLDPAERKADQERKQKAIFDNIPKYQGPPGDPKVLAEIEARLAKLGIQTKPPPPPEDNEPF